MAASHPPRHVTRRRLLVVVILAVAIALVMLLAPRQPAEPPLAIQAASEAATRTPQAPSTPAAGLPAEAGALVYGCPEVDGPVVVRPGRTGARKQVIPCRPTETPATCLLPTLPPGDYTAVQWPFWTDFAVGEAGTAPPVTISCLHECSVEVVVDAVDGCEGPGTAEIRYWGSAVGGPETVMATATWFDGAPVLLDGLPCLPLGLLWVTADGCGVKQQEFAPDAVRQTLRVELSGTELLTLLVKDAETGLPIEGARVRCPYCSRPILPSAADGTVEIEASAATNQSATVAADGYADTYLLFSSLDRNGRIGEDGTIEVPLLPTAPAWVRCTDGGADCGSDVKVWVDSSGLERWDQDCVPDGPGRWRCPATKRDFVKARAPDRRWAPPKRIRPGQTIEIELPSAKASVCLRWPGEPSMCRMELVPFGYDSVVPRGFEVPALVSGMATEIPAGPNEAFGAVLWCGETGWTGQVTAAEPDATSCLDITLVEGGSVCVDEQVSVRLDLGGSILARTSWDGSQQGCSDIVPAGTWTASSEAGRVSGVVDPGETLELRLAGGQGDGR